MRLVVFQPVVRNKGQILDDEKEVASKLGQLEWQLATVNSEIGRISQEVAEMETQLQAAYPELSDALSQLEAELIELWQNIQSTAPSESRVNQEEILEQQRRNFQEQQFKHQMGVETGAKGRDVEVKALFKRISQKTHPDKIRFKPKKEQEIMRELFLEARAAYELNDLRSLQEVWDSLMKMRTRLLSRLLSKLRETEQRLLEASTKLARIKQGSQYKMVVDFKVQAHRSRVEQFYDGLVRRKIEEMKSSIRQLDPERYKVQSSTSYHTPATNVNGTWV